MIENKECKLCGNSFAPKSVVMVFCSNSCKNKFHKLIRSSQYDHAHNCDLCGKKILKGYRPRNKNNFCDKECREKYFRNLGRISNCNACGKEFVKLNDKQAYCSKDCFEKSNVIKKEIKQCKICGNDFLVTGWNRGQTLCSNKCQGEWQRQFRTGENAPNFNKEIPEEDRMVECEICGKMFKTSLDVLNTRRFCNEICRRKWYAEEWSQSKEWKLESSLRAVRILSSGVFTKSTSPQNIINNSLTSMNIRFENEYNIKFYSVDNYLNENGLFIEVMGDYWHCNPVKYKNIPYEMQKKRIIKDKAKHTYVKHKYEKEILYLWEMDIVNNLKKCELLISNYVEANGNILNYHSFNYDVVDGLLRLKDDKITPYMEYSSEEINSVCKFSNLPQLEVG